MIDSIRHYTSHQQLIPSRSDVEPHGDGDDAGFDAIIVPSARPAWHLAAAIELAAMVDSWLVLIVSRAAKLRDVRSLASSLPPCKILAISIPRDHDHALAALASPANTGAPGAHRRQRSDLSHKRNIGLILARLLNWTNIFFMDDDIRGAQPADLLRAASFLGPYRCVGFSISHFPDNSVVSHARRLSNGGHPEICIGGSALGVSIGPEADFFPDIYNEDLFFLIHQIERGVVLHTGSLTQISYDPFDCPDRAASEEFGEVLMEGLLALVHEGRSISQAAMPDYWTEFLQLRRSHLGEIIDSLQRSDSKIYRSAIESLRAAETALFEIMPMTCSSYISRWQDDRLEWQRRFRELPIGIPLSTALHMLNLPRHEILGFNPSPSL